MGLEVAVGVWLLAWRSKQLDVLQKLSLAEAQLVVTQVFCSVSKKTQKPKPNKKTQNKPQNLSSTWIWKLQGSKCRAHRDVGMGRACTHFSACLGLWHVVGVYSCDKGSDEMAPYKQSRISSPKYT